ILALEPGAHDAFLNLRCGYTESPGAPWLRDVLATVYSQISPDQLVVLSAAEEAIFVFYHALLTPQDHAIVETPCYESALTVPKSTGALSPNGAATPGTPGPTISLPWNLSSVLTRAPFTSTRPIIPPDCSCLRTFSVASWNSPLATAFTSSP